MPRGYWAILVPESGSETAQLTCLPPLCPAPTGHSQGLECGEKEKQRPSVPRCGMAMGGNGRDTGKRERGFLTQTSPGGTG